MRLAIEIQGLDVLLRDLGEKTSGVKAVIGQEVMRKAADIEAGVKLRIQQGPKNGRIYKRRSITHQASAPGEAPASDIGTLMGSIYHERETALSAVAGSRLQKSIYLEFGTTRIGPRPAWVPEVEEHARDWPEELRAAIRGVLR